MHAFQNTISGSIRWYWGNAVITAFSDSLISFALILLILNVTGSLSLMALMSIVIAVPNILFGLLNAVWVDRWDPVRVVQMSQICRAAIVTCFLVVDRFDQIWLAFAIAFAQSVVGTFDDPARGKLARALTTDQTRLSVNSFTQSGRTIASVAGTTAAGLLVATAGDNYWPVFIVAAIGYSLAGWVVGHIGRSADGFPNPPVQQQAESFRAEFVQGLTAVTRSRTLTAVMLTAAAATIGASAATVLLTPLIVDELRISPAWFGLVEASQAVGTIIVSFSIGVIGGKINPRSLAVIALIGTGAAIALIGSSPNLFVLLLAMLLVGMTISPVNSAISTIFQSHADHTMIGRVAAVINMVVEPFSILGMAGAGLLADQIGIRPVFWIAGTICAIAGLIASLLFGRDVDSGGTTISTTVAK